MGIFTSKSKKAADEAFEQAGVSYGKKDYDDAILNYSITIKLDPAHETAYVNRGLSYFNKQQYDLTVNDANSALDINPESAWAYNVRGRGYMGKGEKAQAVSDLQKAVQLDGSAKNFKDNLLKAQAMPDFPKQTEAAAKAFDEATAYFNNKDFDNAILKYTETIALDPDDAIAYANRGLAYYNKQQFDLAIKDANSALGINPNSAHAYNTRGRGYMGKNEKALAISDFEKAVKLDGSKQIYKDNLQIAQYMTGPAPASTKTTANTAASTACTGCNTQLESGATFCDTCGAKQDQPQFCEMCGASKQPGAKFCDACGAECGN
jgi:tetratricopeptide (TPR) repeat protein